MVEIEHVLAAHSHEEEDHEANDSHEEHDRHAETEIFLLHTFPKIFHLKSSQCRV